MGATSLWPLAAFVVPALLLFSAGAVALRTRRDRSPERCRALGLLLVLCFVAGYAVLLGQKRAGAGFTDYYGLLPSLALCASYYIGGLYCPPRLGRCVQLCL